MSDEAKRRKQDDEDAGLTPEERRFKHLYPNTWEQVMAERERQERQPKNGGAR